MPKRLNTRTIPTPELQGEDSYVVVRRLTVGETREMRKRARKPLGKDEDRVEINIEITSEQMAECVLKWNWIDNDDAPLPQPHHNVEVFDVLSDEEFEFLGNVLLGGGDDRKN